MPASGDRPAEHARPPGGTVTVAVDGSTTSHRAAAWAAVAAVRRGRDLTLLFVNDRPGYPAPLPVTAEVVEEGRAVGREVLGQVRRTVADALAAAQVPAEELTVHEALVDGPPATGILEQSRDAALLVLGRRGGGGFTGLLLGSTAAQVVQYAELPVVVVPAGTPPPDPAGPGVVLGVDIGETCAAAAAFAFEEASRAQRPLTAVRGWTFLTEEPALRTQFPRPEDLESAQRRLMSEALAGWTEKFPDVPLRTRLVRRHAARALVDAAEGADLVVVGARGAGGFAGLRLGSVSDAVLRHAPCPVAVVR